MQKVRAEGRIAWVVSALFRMPETPRLDLLCVMCNKGGKTPVFVKLHIAEIYLDCDAVLIFRGIFTPFV
jgi:hypothetical protein